jgi:hypothetical protein
LLRQVKEMNEALSIQTILFILLTTLNVLNDTYRTLENYLILKKRKKSMPITKCQMAALFRLKNSMFFFFLNMNSIEHSF